MTARVEGVVTRGVFNLDGHDFDVDNNVWVVGDDSEVVVVDAAHDAEAILTAVNGRTVRAVVCTHAHNDHVNAVRDLVRETGAVVRLHPADTMLWDVVNADVVFEPLADGGMLEVAGVELRVLHTPGHSPGGTCLWAPALGVVLSGDTLFHGGAGATGRSFSDFPTILRSIHDRLLTLPPATRVLPGHGDETTIGAETGGFDEWDASGR